MTLTACAHVWVYRGCMGGGWGGQRHAAPRTSLSTSLREDRMTLTACACGCMGGGGQGHLAACVCIGGWGGQGCCNWPPPHLQVYEADDGPRVYEADRLRCGCGGELVGAGFKSRSRGRGRV